MPSLEQIRRQRRLDAERANAGKSVGDGVDDAAVAAGTEPIGEIATPQEPVAAPAGIQENGAIVDGAYDNGAEDDAGTDKVGVSGEPVMHTDAPESRTVVSEPVVQGAAEEGGPASGTDAQEDALLDAAHDGSGQDAPVDADVPFVEANAGQVPEERGGSVLEDADGERGDKHAGNGKPASGKKRTQPKKRGRPAVADDFKGDGITRVKLPMQLVSMMRSYFPDASNNAEAVAAWIYAKSDKTVDVPDSVKRLAATYTGDQMSNLVKDVSERLAVLDARTMKMQMLTDGRVQEMWYMVAYLMLERMDALAKTHMKDLDLSLPVFETLRSEVNSQFRKVRNRQQLSDGRQVYQRKVQGKRNDVKD